MMLNIIKRIFKKKETEYKPCIEHDTECDKCEFLSECVENGYAINCTTEMDSREHFIPGIGAKCKKWLED